MTPSSSREMGVEKLAGTTAELLVATELLRHGFGASIPVGDTEGYDLISDSGGKILRIQVKSSSVKTPKGVYRVGFVKGNKKRLYTTQDADMFVAVLSYNSGPAFYVIPLGRVKQHGAFWAPGEHPLPQPKWRVCKYEEFRDRWDLLR